jgi:hypothetical protein
MSPNIPKWSIALLATVVVSCKPSTDIDNNKHEEYPQSMLFVDNRTKVSVQNIIVFSAGPHPKVLWKNNERIGSRVLQSIFFDGHICMLVLQIDYVDGITQKTEEQDFCQRPVFILREKERKTKKHQLRQISRV